ncbi:MAG: hypothetical protein JGK26_18885 [Microcoleus sp. PH2017_27_LUM_O_A]|uniref:hypothetical protein n=1 Tax=unclassified Microcoleus TaxID=2642155 RepID=UPI001DEEF7FC|nr:MULTISPECIES: hypothetical protein [unclassified Microcoleus]MCC3461923.1 hypothetical protein [Microcoleus sp. PH2017_11_PCY_U_A]MCC3561163.1 hypothetical protein [Microcoleus sp. PH2017_27_LUM_O_A]
MNFLVFDPAQKRIQSPAGLWWRDQNFRLLFNLPDSKLQVNLKSKISNLKTDVRSPKP